MKSINSINDFCRFDHNINSYNNLSSKYETNYNEYRLYFNSHLTSHGSVCGTWYYMNARKYLYSFIGLSRRENESYYINTEFLGKKIYITSSIELNSGVLIKISYMFNEVFIFNPKSNLKYTKENIEKLSLQWLEKNLMYSNGILRDFQLRFSLNKKDAIYMYKLSIENKKKELQENRQDYIACEKSLVRWLKKHKNIELKNYINIFSDFKKLSRIECFPKLTKINSRILNITFQDIEDILYSEGLEADEESIHYAIDIAENCL